MHSATRLDDLKILECFLQNSLHAHLGRIVPFKVQCLYKDGTLWVLAQHPADVAIDIPETFSVLERALQAEEPKTPLAVRMYLRAEGNQRPYTQHSFTVYPLVKDFGPGEAAPEMTGMGEDRFAVEHRALDPLQPNSTNEVPTTIPEVVVYTAGDRDEEHRIVKVDADAFVSDLENSFSNTDERRQSNVYPPATERSKSQKLLPVLGGIGLLAAIAGAGYMGTRPCVFNVCTELDTSAQLNRASSTTLSNPNATVPEVLTAQKQLHQSVETLKSIPAWSGSYGRAQQSLQTTEPQVEYVDSAVAAMNQAYQATLIVAKPPVPVAKWQQSKQLLTNSVATLGKIPSNSSVYPLARQKLGDYQAKLGEIERRISAENTAQERLKSAIAGIASATAAQTVAKSATEWRSVNSQWTNINSTLESIPATTSSYPQAQLLLKSAQPQLATARTKLAEEEQAAKNYQNALSLAQAAKQAQQNRQLDRAVTAWSQSVAALQSIPQTAEVSAQAKPLVTEYTKNFQQAEAQLKTERKLVQASKDLQRTCAGTPQICTFTVTDKGLDVRLLPLYTQTLMQTAIAASTQGDDKAKVGVRNHVDTLGNALQTIGENAKLPIAVYNADGKQIQKYRP